MKYNWQYIIGVLFFTIVSVGLNVWVFIAVDDVILELIVLLINFITIPMMYLLTQIDLKGELHEVK